MGSIRLSTGYRITPLPTKKNQPREGATYLRAFASALDRRNPQISRMTQIEQSTTTIRDPETYAIIGAAMVVHSTLGRGFLELVYQEAMEVELNLRRIQFAREVEIPVFYRGSPLAVRYRADYICFRDVLVELKACDRLTGVDGAQVINYLVATRLSRGLLLNFGAATQQYRRFAGPASLVANSSVQSVESVDPTTLTSPRP
jgi:hypothetical protein